MGTIGVILAGAACAALVPAADKGVPGPVATVADLPHRAPVARQVRIEQRIIIRVPARGSRNLDRTLEALRVPRPLPRRWEEKRYGRCVQAAQIAGVQMAGDGRLLLLLTDDRRLVAGLPGNCRARDFYSGFYVERAEDGKICTNRDELHARNGARCSVEELRELVVAER